MFTLIFLALAAISFFVMIGGFEVLYGLGFWIVWCFNGRPHVPIALLLMIIFLILAAIH